MFREVVISQDAAFLASECHFDVELLHTLSVKITLCHIDHGLTRNEAEHKSVNDSYLIKSTKHHHKRNQYSVFNIFRSFCLLFSFSSFEDWKVIINQMIIHFAKSFKRIKVLSKSGALIFESEVL